MTSKDESVERCLATLHLEYSTLRAEIVATSAARFQFLTIPPVALAVSVGIVGASTSRQGWVAPAFFSIIGGLIVAGVLIFLWIGRVIGALSARIAEIELATNQMLKSAGYTTADLLVWESRHQYRSGLARFYNGPGRPPKDP